MSFYVVRARYEQLHVFSLMNECNCLYRCHSMLFVLVMSRVTCVFTHERVCNCLFRCHSMLFVLVMSRVTCVFTHERVCNCLFRCHSMLFVLVMSRVHVFLLMNECVIVIQVSFFVVRARYEPCYMCFYS